MVLTQDQIFGVAYVVSFAAGYFVHWLVEYDKKLQYRKRVRQIMDLLGAKEQSTAEIKAEVVRPTKKKTTTKRKHK